MTKPFKIGVTGSNNTGKTTLAMKIAIELKERGLKADYRYESVSSCPTGTKEKGTLTSQRWILSNIIQTESVMEHSGKYVIVCDRTPIGICAYSRFHYEKNPTEENRSDLFLIEYISKAYIDTYNLVLLAPIDDSIPFNPWYKNIDHRKEIDKILRNFLKKNRIDYIELKQKKEERLRQSLSILKEKGIIQNF